MLDEKTTSNEFTHFQDLNQGMCIIRKSAIIGAIPTTGNPGKYTILFGEKQILHTTEDFTSIEKKLMH